MSLEGKLAGQAVHHALDTGEEEDGCDCECSQKTWPSILCGLGLGASLFIIVASILTLMKIPTIILFILDCYCVALALLGAVAEARRFKVLRGLCYKIIRYVYILTTYSGRGFFYIFMGTIMFDDDNYLNMACTGYCITVGIMTMFLNCRYKLPTYIDPQKLKEMQAERIRAEVEAQYAQAHETSAAAAQNAQNTAYGAQNGAYSAAQNTYSQANTTANAGGRPPASGSAYGGFAESTGPAAPYSPPHLR